MKRKTPYSLVTVKQICLESIIAARSGQACIVGVDVAKGELVACLYWPDRSFDRPWKIESPGETGLLVTMLKELSSRCPLVVAMESSGTYGDVLRQALFDSGIEVRRVSSKAVKDHAETFDGVPSQHDGKDAAVIAELAWMGKGSPWSWRERPQEDQAMRFWIRKLDTAQRIKQVYCGKLAGQNGTGAISLTARRACVTLLAHASRPAHCSGWNDLSRQNKRVIRVISQFEPAYHHSYSPAPSHPRRRPSNLTALAHKTQTA